MKSMKKIAVSLLTAVALTGSAFGAFAADVNSIKSCNITIINSDNTETSVTDKTNITINPNQMLKFEVELENDGDVTLFSAKDGETTYNNGTIQYVAQSASKATLTFKPRATLGEGTYSVKVGGTDVAEALTCTYTVTNPLKVDAVNKYAMILPESLSDEYVSLYVEPEYATYKISGVDSVDNLVVKAGESEYTKDDDYTVSAKDNDGKFTLTIKNRFANETAGTKTLTITADGLTKDFDVEVCPAVKCKTLMRNDSSRADEMRYVYVPATPKASSTDSEREFTLKPVESDLSQKTPKSKVVSQCGYFKAWTWSDYDISESVGNIENGIVKADYNSERANDVLSMYQYSFNTTSSDVQSGTVENDIISKAGAQAIKYNDSTGAEKEAIRFIALIDFDESYTSAGFVVSDLHYNPTIEGGFAKSTKEEAYKNIYARTTSGETVLKSVDDLKSKINDKLNDGLDAIITSVLNVSSDAQKNRTIYATPYVVKSDGTRVYGVTIGVKYNDLITASTGE